MDPLSVIASITGVLAAVKITTELTCMFDGKSSRPEGCKVQELLYSLKHGVMNTAPDLPRDCLFSSGVSRHYYTHTGP